MRVVKIYQKLEKQKILVGTMTFRDDYDIYVEYEKTCPTCKGEKILGYSSSYNPIGSVVCHTCRGRGFMP